MNLDSLSPALSVCVCAYEISVGFSWCRSTCACVCVLSFPELSRFLFSFAWQNPSDTSMIIISTVKYLWNKCWRYFLFSTPRSSLCCLAVMEWDGRFLFGGWKREKWQHKKAAKESNTNKHSKIALYKTTSAGRLVKHINDEKKTLDLQMHGNGCFGVFVQTFKMAKRELSANIQNRQHTN